MKKYLLYGYLGVMFTCLLGAGNLTETYQKPVVALGMFLFGIFLTIGMAFVWRKKAPLQGRGLNVEFSKHPIVYGTWLLVVGGFGLAMVAAAMTFAISHAFGIVLVPWLN
jgi:hypothetical protein